MTFSQLQLLANISQLTKYLVLTIRLTTANNLSQKIVKNYRDTNSERVTRQEVLDLLLKIIKSKANLDFISFFSLQTVHVCERSFSTNS